MSLSVLYIALLIIVLLFPLLSSLKVNIRMTFSLFISLGIITILYFYLYKQQTFLNFLDSIYNTNQNYFKSISLSEANTRNILGTTILSIIFIINYIFFSFFLRLIIKDTIQIEIESNNIKIIKSIFNFILKALNEFSLMIMFLILCTLFNVFCNLEYGFLSNFFLAILKLVFNL